MALGGGDSLRLVVSRELVRSYFSHDVVWCGADTAAVMGHGADD